uniref:Ig-like domain-containing protein n=1 Tax=Steinernema glaseri TaxID=37863 RepID=A0A1I7ZXG1_9BILA
MVTSGFSACLLLLLLAGPALGCRWKDEKYKDGETWVVRSTFVMKCSISADGGWRTSIVACQTPLGKELKPGETVTEGDTKVECTKMADGSVRINRHYKSKTTDCEGHAVGESWISKRNFNKTCTAKGQRISNCVTDSGIAFPLDSKYTVSGIVYSCIQHKDNTVSIVRDNVSPNPKADEKPKVITWIEEEKFVKKCSEEGSVAVVACLITKDEQLELNSKKSVGGKTYFCRQNPDGTVFFQLEN